MCNLTKICKIRAADIHTSLVIMKLDIVGAKRAKMHLEDFVYEVDFFPPHSLQVFIL